MNVWFSLAALAAFATFLAHTFVGTGPIARPLLERACNLSPVSRYTNYYCWHLVTMTLLAQSACFAWAAMPGKAIDLAVLATALAVGFLVWSVVLNLRHRLALATAPQWIFFLPMAGLGLLGLFL